MPTELITLPLRLGLRVASIVLRPVAGVVEHALGLDRDGQPAAPEPPRTRPTRVPPRPGPRPHPTPPRPPPPRSPPRPRRFPPRPRREPRSRADVPDEPEHVS